MTPFELNSKRREHKREVIDNITSVVKSHYLPTIFDELESRSLSSIEPMEDEITLYLSVENRKNGFFFRNCEKYPELLEEILREKLKSHRWELVSFNAKFYLECRFNLTIKQMPSMSFKEFFRELFGLKVY